MSEVVSSSSREVDVITSTTDQAGLVGQISPFCLVGGALVACFSSDVWSYVQLFDFTNQISNAKLTDAEIISTVYGHEMGHALSMAHTSPPTGTASIMSTNSRTSYLPQAFDKTNLRKKWGN